MNAQYYQAHYNVDRQLVAVEAVIVGQEGLLLEDKFEPVSDSHGARDDLRLDFIAKLRETLHRRFEVSQTLLEITRRAALRCLLQTGLQCLQDQLNSMDLIAEFFQIVISAFVRDNCFVKLLATCDRHTHDGDYASDDADFCRHGS